jgi:hypothetical protein
MRRRRVSLEYVVVCNSQTVSNMISGNTVIERDTDNTAAPETGRAAAVTFSVSMNCLHSAQ